MKTPPTGATLVRPEVGWASRVWSPPLLRVAEMQAARGNFRLAADLCEWMLGDDRLRGLLATRGQQLFGLTPTFEASGDGRRKGVAVKALEVGEDWWAMCPEDVCILHLVWGLLFGLSLGRLEWWETVRGKRVPRRRKGRNVPLLTWWHPRNLRWDDETQGWFVRLVGGHEERIEPGAGEWVLFAPYGTTAPHLLALWRGLAKLCLLKGYSIPDLARHLEKGSSLFVEAGESAIAEERKEVRDQLSTLGTDAVAVLPNGYKANLLEARSTGQMYVDAAGYADKAFAVDVLSHANNAEVLDAKTGSTAGQVLRHEGREFDARRFETFAHDQILTHWAAWNFGTPDLAPWPEYPTEPDASMGDEGDGLKKLGEGATAARNANPRVDVDALYEKHGVPLLPAAPTPAPVAPPPAPAPAPAAAA